MAANEEIVIDTSPLILLAKVGLLPVVQQLPYQFTAPREVIDELRAGNELGRHIVHAPWLRVRTLRSPVAEMIRATLDKGEAAVIQLALENRIRHVCMDDLRGRRIAKAVGLEVIGVLGLLGKAKRRGLIPEIAAYADRLVAAGAHYSPALIASVVADVDGK